MDYGRMEEYHRYKVVKSYYVARLDVLERHGASNYYQYADETPTTPEEISSIITSKEEAIEFAKKEYNNSNSYDISGNDLYILMIDVIDIDEEDDNVVESFGLSLEECEKIVNEEEED